MQKILRKAIEFHGHLGPWLVLGILMGAYALRKLKAKKYFGLKVKAWGLNHKPKSCLLDGLQLSTGATYGKGNIEKLNGKIIRASFHNLTNNKTITVSPRKDLLKKLNDLKGYRDAEVFARRLLSFNPDRLFEAK